MGGIACVNGWLRPGAIRILNLQLKLGAIKKTESCIDVYFFGNVGKNWGVTRPFVICSKA